MKYVYAYMPMCALIDTVYIRLYYLIYYMIYYMIYYTIILYHISYLILDLCYDTNGLRNKIIKRLE